MSDQEMDAVDRAQQNQIEAIHERNKDQDAELQRQAEKDLAQDRKDKEHDARLEKVDAMLVRVERSVKFLMIWTVAMVMLFLVFRRYAIEVNVHEGARVETVR